MCDPVGFLRICFHTGLIVISRPKGSRSRNRLVGDCMLLCNTRNEHCSAERKGISAMSKSEKRVVFLGPKYTFSHEAALNMFPRARPFYARSPREIFDQVSSGEMDYGILPVENSATGLVAEFFPLLVNQPFVLPRHHVKVRITKELFLPIHQHLLARGKPPLAEVQTVYTHRQPYLQSIDWMNQNLRDVRIEFTDSTAAAAEKLAQDADGTCIGGDLLAKHERLVKIRENIHDYGMNVTRFVAVSSRHTRIGKDSNKTTFAITIPDRVGTLVQVFQLISSGGINMESLRMTPARGDSIDSRVFKDWFVIDVGCHANSTEFHALLDRFEQAEELIREHKFLGSYVSGWKDEFTGRRKSPIVPELPPADLRPVVQEMMASGESDRVEFKSSLRYDYKERSVNKELAKVVAKSMCGFLNTTGGYLLIGVSDAGEALGIENDINLLRKKSVDGFLSTFYQVVSDMIGKEFARYIHPEIVELDGERVCCVRLETSAKAAWLAEKGSYTLFIRVGNSTRPLNAKEANDYILSRFSLR